MEGVRNSLFMVLLIYISALASLLSPMIGAATMDTGRYNCPTIGRPVLSNDGKTVAYVISHPESRELFIQRTNGQVLRRVKDAKQFLFSKSSRFIVYAQLTQAFVFNLITGKTDTVNHCSSFDMFSNASGEYLFYKRQDSDVAVLFHLQLKTRKQYRGIDGYYFSPDHSQMAFVQPGSRESGPYSSIVCVDLQTNKMDTVFAGRYTIPMVVFDQSVDRLAFITSAANAAGPTNAIWCYWIKSHSLQQVVVPGVSRINDGWDIAENNARLQFSTDGSRLFFNMRKTSISSTRTAGFHIGVSVWNYEDQSLKFEEAIQSTNRYRTYQAVADIRSKVVYLLEQEDDVFGVQRASGNDEWVLAVSSAGSSKETNWHGNFTLFLVNTVNGQRKQLAALPENYATISPNGKYVYWFDTHQQLFFTYNIRTAVTCKIAQGMDAKFVDHTDDHPGYLQPYSMPVWTENDEQLLLYDQFDVWVLDPNGVSSPANITHAFGETKRIIFRVIRNTNYPDTPLPFHRARSLLLMAFDPANKRNGFYSVPIDSPENPIKRVLDGNAYFFDELFLSALVTSETISPIKARDVDVFLCEKMNSRETPELYATRDFIQFTQLSSVGAIGDCSGTAADLYQFAVNDSTMGSGILYKPVDFDSTRKYPVIFTYYEQLSDGLNKFLRPGFNSSSINIPFFVQHGYLVFVPDIHYRVGVPGESAAQTLIAAANHLSQKPWVDSMHIGLQGHSFGGFETNYIILTTHRFAAACSFAGPTDFISMYGSYRPFSGASNQYFMETGQLRIGGTLFATPRLFVNNSPVFYSQNISTPLLIVQNPDDTQVPWLQGIEFFQALRRCSKKVWMLGYPGEGHTLENEKHRVDYSAKLLKFFGYYLMQQSLPDWMQ